MPIATEQRFRVLCFATFFHFLAMGVFLSGLPLFVDRELHASKAAVGFAVGCFSVTAVLTRPWVGRRVDRIGRVWFVRGAPVLIAVTCVGLLFAESLPAIIALRLAQGLAGAAFYTSAATVATDLAPDDRRADYISRFSLFLYGGFATGPAVGEFVIDHWSYRWAWTAAGASALVAMGVALVLTETKPARPRHEHQGRRRIVHPAAIGPGIPLLMTAVGYTAISSFTPLYARHIGMGSSGGLYITFSLTILFVRLVSGRLADRFGRAAVALPGVLAAAGGMFVLALIARPAAAFAGVALFGAGHALLFPALMALTVDRVPDSERGEALGSFTACFDVGASTGGYLVGWVGDRAGFGAAWATPGVLALLGALWLILFARGRLVSSDSEPHPDLEPAGA